jgi:phosphoserine phosphatase
MMNLILQGIAVPRSAINRIAAIASAQRISPIHDNAFCCEGVNVSEQIKLDVERACALARLDCGFIAERLRWSDYKLLAMDMDSTLITIECIDEIADMQGLKLQVAAITEAAMRGEIEFNESLTRRVALLAGLDASALERVYNERLQLSPGAETMLTAVKASGLKTLLVSGGFTFFTDRIRERLGLDFSHANQLEIVDGKLTGRVLGGIVNAEEKKYTVQRICTELGIDPSATIVMGDGANDLQMMSIAGLSVAFRAKPVVRAQAKVALNFVGLDGILSLFARF